jgi:hypothetical protein
VQLDDAWFCSTPCLEKAVRDRLARVTRPLSSGTAALPPPRLGALLLAANSGLTPELLRRGLEAQRTSGRRLGEELLRLGAVSTEEVVRALAVQANTRYLTAIHPATVRAGHGNLPRDMVRALGLVPFAAHVQSRVLKVAYVAPLPRIALAALRELTNWTPEPYLVADAMWPGLIHEYGTNPTADCTRGVATADSLGDASLHIARAAEQTRGARISHARVDPYVWVRLEASNQIEDLLLTVPEFGKEHAWQTGRTSH